LATEDRETILATIGDGDGNLLEEVAELCDGTGGLILVFDQLEEVLRAGERTANRVNETIAELMQSGLPLRQLLSLRMEHLADLRGLEKLVGGVVGRTTFLDPMRRDTVEQVIKEVCQISGATITQSSVGEILGWLAAAELDRRGIDDAAERAANDGAAGDRPDLLSLQAILHELFHDAHAEQPDAQLELDGDTLARYREKYGPEGSQIVAKALQRWIARALEQHTDGNDDSEREAAVRNNLPEPHLTGLVYRVATRIAPHLATGDFKVAQEEADLFRKAMGNDVWGLGLRDPELRRIIKISPDGLLVNPDELGLSNQFDGSGEFLSGLALAGSWSAVETATAMAWIFYETLARLQKGNVVKPILSPSRETLGKATSWELVHDRVGPAFVQWAEDRRDTFADCVSSLVASRGVSPILILGERGRDAMLSGRVHHVRWEGCVIGPVHGRAFFEEVEFENCFLRGTIFEDCVFRGATFRQCVLHGALFKRCSFVGGTAGKPVTIERCPAASLGFLGGRAEALKFVECQLDQPTLVSMELAGSVGFEGTRVKLALLEGLHTGEGVLQFDARSTLEFSTGDAKSWSRVLLTPEIESSTSRPLVAE
jgi:hypothetical protein